MAKRVNRIEANWRSKFARFVHSYGVASLAARLDIQHTAISHWIRGSTTPRPAHAEMIQRIARTEGVDLSFDDIYRHGRDVRARNGESLGTSLKSLATNFSDDGDPRECKRARRGNVLPMQWM